MQKMGSQKNFTDKIEDRGSRHFEISNTAIFERIRTKFDTETENEVPDLVLPAKLIS